MTYREIIMSIKPYNNNEYSHISSMEKLGAYSAMWLVEKGVPLTFNYLSIAMFKMFPDRFCCDEEFKEYPSIDRINRTIMHMTITAKKNDSILAGSAKLGYHITDYGLLIATNTFSSINNGETANISIKNIKNKRNDNYNEGVMKEYSNIHESKYFQEYCESGVVSKFVVWKIFSYIPFTHNDSIVEKLKLANIKAVEVNDLKVIEFLKILEAQLDN